MALSVPKNSSPSRTTNERTAWHLSSNPVTATLSPNSVNRNSAAALPLIVCIVLSFYDELKSNSGL